MSHTPVPEKLDRDEFYNIIHEMEGVLGSISQFSPDKAVLKIAEKLDEIIDWAHSIEKRMGGQPSEEVRPVVSGGVKLHEAWEQYPTRGTAETARNMLLGE